MWRVGPEKPGPRSPDDAIAAFAAASDRTRRTTRPEAARSAVGRRHAALLDAGIHRSFAFERWLMDGALLDLRGESVSHVPSRSSDGLVGIGLYTLAEAGRLVHVAPSTISRWLRGHDAGGRRYEPLWHSQVDLGEDGLFLGFRDLQEVRVVAAFIARGLSPQRVRQAIGLARDLVGDERPLSTKRFRTDGRSLFLQMVEEDGQTKLIDLFKRQFAFREIIEQSLTNLEYDDGGSPSLWWPLGRGGSVVVDPARSFGQPIEAETSIPTATLAAAAKAEGSQQAAARAWGVPLRSVRRAVAFEDHMALRKAA